MFFYFIFIFCFYWITVSLFLFRGFHVIKLSTCIMRIDVRKRKFTSIIYQYHGTNDHNETVLLVIDRHSTLIVIIRLLLLWYNLQSINTFDAEIYLLMAQQAIVSWTINCLNYNWDYYFNHFSNRSRREIFIFSCRQNKVGGNDFAQKLRLILLHFFFSLK